MLFLCAVIVGVSIKTVHSRFASDWIDQGEECGDENEARVGVTGH